MDLERAMELLNNIVNFVSVGNNTPEQIEELLMYGFEPSELVDYFGYSKADVEAYGG